MTASRNLLSLKGSGGGLTGLFAGALYPLRALKLFLKTPGLRSYVLLPILLNLVLGVTVYAGLLTAGLQGIDWFIAQLPNWVPQLPSPHFTAPHLPPVRWASPTWLPSLPGWHFSVPPWVSTLPLPDGFHLPQWQFPQGQFPQWTFPQWTFPQWTFPQGHWPTWLSQPSTWQWPHWWPDGLTWRVPEWLAHPGWVSTTAAIFLVALLKSVLIVLLLILTGFIFLQFGVLLGAPWYGKLSEELERLYTGQVTTIEVGLAQDVGRAIAYELKKLALFVGLGLPLFLLNFVPGVGTAIATVGGLALTTTIICMDFMDAAVERRRPRFRNKLALVRQCLPASAGFGLVCLGLISIPLINLLSIPLCVAAGTLFFCDRIVPIAPPHTTVAE